MAIRSFNMTFKRNENHIYLDHNKRMSNHDQINYIVKPVYNAHTRDLKIVAVVER